MEGELAEVNPFRFSSEYHDDETSLVYYNPLLGKWTKCGWSRKLDNLN